MKLPFTLGLRGRLILILLAAFAALLGMILVHMLAHRAERLRDAAEQLQHDAQLIAARQQGIAAQAEAILNGLMLRPELQPGASTENCSAILQSLLKDETAFINAGVTLPGGEVACAAVPPAGRVSFGDRPHFQQAFQSRNMIVSDIIIGRIVKQPLITFVKALRDEAGRVTAIFYVSLDLA